MVALVMMVMDPFAVPQGHISEQKSDCVQNQRAGNVRAGGVFHKAVRDNIITKAPLSLIKQLWYRKGTRCF